MAILKEITGPEAGRQFRLDRPRVLLGRHPDCDIIIEVGAVSRHHAQVLLIDGEYFVEDLNSRNGTFVNERLIQSRHRLSQDDCLRVCDVSFAFQWGPAERSGAEGEESSACAVLVDDGPSTRSSTIMSRLDVSAQEGGMSPSSSAAVKLSALMEFTQSLGKALSLDEVLPQLLNSLFKIFTQADRGFIVLRQDDGQLVPRWTKMRHQDEDDTIRISRTIVNHVIDSREAVSAYDAADDERFEMSQSMVDLRIRSLMCAPLINIDGNVLGVLEIDTLDRRHQFQPADLEVLASVASQAAIAIDNAQLHDRAIQQRALERELELANQVQQSFLPQSRPEVPGYQFHDYYRPANQIGGDYFDYVALPDGRVAVLVADVVGHGVAAALLMARLSSECRFSLATEQDPAKVLNGLNVKLCQDHIDDRFVTLVLVVLHPTRHEVTVVNAGHPAPLLCRPDGTVQEVGREHAGLPLGVVIEATYKQHQFKLDPGHVFAMFTDGLSEAMDEEGELYGLDRVRRQAMSGPSSPKALVEQLVEDVTRFVGSRAPTDDMCVVSFGRTLAGAGAPATKGIG
jgi:serine phosphatase RsbU (regulator of sigma subunit)/pSer/pThr/pTyr-binding forkhead associated (FHA) protein